MFNRLIKHGCTDLTAVMATNRHSSSPIASGGFGDVRRSKMVNGTYVAVKTLRLHTLLQGKEKGTKVISYLPIMLVDILNYEFGIL